MRRFTAYALLVLISATLGTIVGLVLYGDIRMLGYGSLVVAAVALIGSGLLHQPRKGEPMNRSEQLENALRSELVYLWDDLDKAKRDAHNGTWSTRCDGLVDRIKKATELVGPIPWEQVPYPLLTDGTFQQVHTDMGITIPPEDIRKGREAAQSYYELPAALDGHDPDPRTC